MKREIRFVFAQARVDPGNNLPVSQFSDGTPIYWKTPLNRQRGGDLIDSKAFQFGRRKQRAHEFSRAIAQVVIGPRCELSVEEIKSELQRNGFKGVDIVKSDCAIR